LVPRGGMFGKKRRYLIGQQHLESNRVLFTAMKLIYPGYFCCCRSCDEYSEMYCCWCYPGFDYSSRFCWPLESEDGTCAVVYKVGSRYSDFRPGCLETMGSSGSEITSTAEEGISFSMAEFKKGRFTFRPDSENPFAATKIGE